MNTGYSASDQSFQSVRIAAGIVTYNPDIIGLRENIDAIASQVEDVFIFDNGSVNFPEIAQLCDGKNVEIIQSDTNKGIAFALNRLFEKADSKGFDWLLTLDQDSVCFPDLIAQYRIFMDQYDSISSFHTGSTGKQEENHTEEVDYCITSGNLVKIKAWKDIHGFNENLFIDMVDVDFCFRLIAAHFKIVKLGYCGFRHHMGDGTIWQLFGKNVFIGNYSEFRKYYIFRNMIYVIRKYHLKHHHYSYKRLMVLFLHALLKEEDKYKRCISMFRGVKDGFCQYDEIESYYKQFESALMDTRGGYSLHLSRLVFSGGFV